MTPTLHQAAQQALDALETCTPGDYSTGHVIHPSFDDRLVDAAIVALEEALAAPQPEPEPEPYLCIAPACGNDCSGCNKAISPQTMRDYAIGYAMLRNAPIEAIRAGGVFAGRTPDNVVINGADLDAATFGAAAQQSIDQQVESINAVFEAWCNGDDASMTIALAAPPAAPAPAVPDLKHKPTVQRLMDLARKFRSAPGDLYDGAYKELQSACYEALSAAPVVREPLTDEQTDEIWDRFEQAPTMGYRYFVTRAILAAVGIGGGGNG